MKTLIRSLLVTSILVGMTVISLRADNYLKNADMKEGFAGWHGDANAAFLKPDGTEGADGDADVIPVIKMSLGGESRSLYQDIETRDKPITMHVKVEVFASSDFKRSPHADDYNTTWKPGSIWYWSAIALPNIDFWIRGGSTGYFYKLMNLKPGAWTTVDGRFENLPQDLDRSIDFCIPAGKGAIYLKNPVAEP
jgi:hypothetical protein